MQNKRVRRQLIIGGFMWVMVLLFTAAHALSEVKRFRGQTVYVPIYSHIYHGDGDRAPFYLTATLSIRNTDSEHSIAITGLDYFDSDGKPLKKFVEKPIRINPRASYRIIIKESDKNGGSGAHFIIKWESEQKVTEPLIESIMIGTKVQQGISFSSRGQVVKEIE